MIQCNKNFNILRDYNLHQVIPVWVINLNRRKDRLLRISTRLDELGVSWERIDAIDGNVCEKNLLKMSAKKGVIGELSQGARGCIASHHIFWKKIISADVEFGIVLEDDIELSDDFRAIVFDKSWIPLNARIIKLEKLTAYRSSKLLLGKSVSSTLDNQRHVHRMYSRHCGSGAYLISKEGANIALNSEKIFSVPLDHVLFNETVSKVSSALSPLMMVPPLAWQTYKFGFDSDIDIQIKISKVKKFLRSVRRAYYETRLLPYQIFALLSGIAKIKSVNKK
jgi:glycosyl transferase family 25